MAEHSPFRAALGLAAYRAIQQRGPAPDVAPTARRPAGELVWIHAPEPGGGRAISDLGRHIVRQRDTASVLITVGEDADLGKLLPGGQIAVEPAPSEHPVSVTAFLDHWRPDIALWIWGGLRPNLILAASERGIPLNLIDAGEAGFDRRRDRWLPEIPRRILQRFDVWMARSEAAHLRLAQLGCPLNGIEVLPPLQPVGQTLGAAESDIEDVRERLAGRYCWFGRGVTATELPLIIAAHRQAIRSAHRLLLLLEPRRPDDADHFAETLVQEGLRIARWSDGAYPSDTTQVLLADTPDETGLWYRIAPVTFLGASLESGGHGHDPYEAAAHGTAVLYGPNVRRYLRSYSRLAAAGAARIVSDADTLASAVSRLIQPAHAAQMASSAWNVITEGAATTDRVIELVCNTLDQRMDRPV